MFIHLAGALSLVCIWSTTALSIKWSVVDYHYSAALFFRFALAFVILLMVAAYRGVKIRPSREAWRAWIAGGGYTVFAMICTYWAAQYVNSGLVAVLYGLNPLLAVILASLLLRQKIQRNEVVGCILALGGLAAIFSEHLHLGAEGIPAFLVILLAVTVNSLGAVRLKVHSQGLDTLLVSTGSIGVCVVASAVVWLAYGIPLPAGVPLRATGAIVYLALVGSVFAMSVYFWLIRECRPTQVALIPMIATVSALWFGYALNNEVLTREVLLGTVLIVAGLGVHQMGVLRSR
ncbi:EamA-like transporter family protein [Formivibrio citricus]|uniref:EamA-like transporter family protein n=1 Tax=Formivibrio citricus TaxID=83765 RepID=A0A1I4YNS8_9NEIS|nr:DMT family transporter [Formivibrio citricus]SFN39688.1 EamA-like transporter family protein [Formivibrio citricus]